MTFFNAGLQFETDALGKHFSTLRIVAAPFAVVGSQAYGLYVRRATKKVEAIVIY